MSTRSAAKKLAEAEASTNPTTVPTGPPGGTQGTQDPSPSPSMEVKMDEKYERRFNTMETRLDAVMSAINAIHLALNPQVRAPPPENKTSLNESPAESPISSPPRTASEPAPRDRFPPPMSRDNAAASRDEPLSFSLGDRVPQSAVNRNSVPAVIEERNQLPPPPKLSGRSIQPDSYLEWKIRIRNMLEGFPRYYPIAFLEPTKSWEEFQQLNAKYDSTQIERHYLIAHRAVWAFITEAFDPKITVQMQEEMEEDTTHNDLPSLLNFRHSTPEKFYKNCYELIRRLDERYQMQSGWKVANLNKQLTEMKYNPSQDPAVFIQDYQALHRKIRLVYPNWPKSDPARYAFDILDKLPAELDGVRNQFYNAKELPTLESVEGALVNWWNDRANKAKSRRPVPGNTKPKEAAHSAVQQERPQGNKYNNNNRNRPPPQQARRDNANNNRQYTFATQDETPDDYQSETQEELSYTEDQSVEDPYDEHCFCAIEEVVAEETAMVANTTTFAPRSQHILWDSASTSHITGVPGSLEDQKRVNPIRVSTLGGEKMVNTVGKMRLNKSVTLEHVRYLPNAPYSLLSIPQVCNANYQVLFTNEGAYILRPKTFSPNQYKPFSILQARKEGNLYVYNIGNRPEPDYKKGDFQYDPSVAKIPKKLDSNSVSNNSTNHARTELQADRDTRVTRNTSKTVAAAGYEITEEKDTSWCFMNPDEDQGGDFSDDCSNVTVELPVPTAEFDSGTMKHRDKG